MFYYENDYLLSAESPKCEDVRDEFFRYIIFDRERRQGWKIHISCTIENHLMIINIVGDYLLMNKISFKYIDKLNSLYYLLSGDAPYGQAGKFITIYPKSDKQFRNIIEDLYPKLDGYQGVYIISDKQFKDSVIYYRFGLFENDGIPYLIDNEGYFVKDERDYFCVPKFENDPFDNFSEADIAYSTLGVTVFPLDIIHTSSSGNVYHSIYEDEVVILKEARRYILGVYGDSIGELQNEINIISFLNNHGIVVPRLLLTFYEEGNFFGVFEEIQGQSLDFFRAINQKIEDTKKIFANLIELLDKIHQVGVVINDISPANFIIKSDLEPVIVDFGSSYFVKDGLKDNIKGATPTFYDESVKDLVPFNSDFHKLGYVLLNYLLPINSVNNYDPTGNTLLAQFKIFAEYNELGYFYEIIILLIRQPLDWKTKLSKLIDRGFSRNTSFVKPRYFKELEYRKKNYEKQTLPDVTLGNRLVYTFSKLLVDEIQTYFKSVIRMSNEDIKHWICGYPDLSIKSGVLGLGLLCIFTDGSLMSDELVNLVEKRMSESDVKEDSLFEGKLGHCLFYLIRYVNTNDDFYLKKCSSLLEEVNKNIKYDDGEYCFIMDYSENISSPYLCDGLSGLIFIALELYKLINDHNYRYRLENEIIKPYCETLRKIKWCKNSGLFFGGLGIGMVLSEVSKVFDDKMMYQDAIELIYNMVQFDVYENGLYVPLSNDKTTSSLRFSDGALGNLFVLNIIGV